ncbi:MAG: hypothetical protein JSW61_08685 [Candidatus Thorarchaeota archaeon]|nr:MAG: hypothetical protein JSW61_08685 [Candidatus Thorarchaeota archaeon]
MTMMTHQISTLQDVREKARKALTDYLTMFIPESWKEPLEKIRLLLQAHGEADWEALKGHSLLYFDEMRLSEDRVESLARVERLGDAFKELYSVVSPAEWHRTVDDTIHAANFRASKAAIQIRHISPLDRPNDDSDED